MQLKIEFLVGIAPFQIMADGITSNGVVAAIEGYLRECGASRSSEYRLSEHHASGCQGGKCQDSKRPKQRYPSTRTHEMPPSWQVSGHFDVSSRPVSQSGRTSDQQRRHRFLASYRRPASGPTTHVAKILFKSDGSRLGCRRQSAEARRNALVGDCYRRRVRLGTLKSCNLRVLKTAHLDPLLMTKSERNTLDSSPFSWSGTAETRPQGAIAIRLFAASGTDRAGWQGRMKPAGFRRDGTGRDARRSIVADHLNGCNWDSKSHTSCRTRHFRHLSRFGMHFPAVKHLCQRPIRLLLPGAVRPSWEACRTALPWPWGETGKTRQRASVMFLERSLSENGVRRRPTRHDGTRCRRGRTTGVGDVCFDDFHA